MEGTSSGGSPDSTTPSATAQPSVHADGVEVAPAPRVSILARHHAGERCPSRAAAPANPLPPNSRSSAPLSQVRAFPIVGANPGPRCVTARSRWQGSRWQRASAARRRRCKRHRARLALLPTHACCRCGHTLTTIAGPDGDLSSAKLILFGGCSSKRAGRLCAAGSIRLGFISAAR